MPDIIHLLPDAVANQIAAGEVIQRPASAVKELLENAVDAGATRITLKTQDAGKTLIQVLDNGNGMSSTDARMAFERHATSKLRTADDLFALHTKGFRGEALASMAAVAQVELRTRKQEDSVGTRLVVAASQVEKQEPDACPSGSNFMVRNLFYNVPARRNFLKSNAVEQGHITEEFTRVALAHPEVAFSSWNGDAETANLPAGNLKQRIVGLFGTPYQERLVPIEETTTIVRISGFVVKPEYARKSRGEQYFFVNNRYIKSPYLHHAVQGALENLVAADQIAGYVIFLEVDPAQVDVNIHPTKTEVKFQDEKAVYAFLRAAVRKGLGQHNITPSLDFEQDPQLAFLPTPKPGSPMPEMPRIRVNPSFNPFERDAQQLDLRQRHNQDNWQTLYTPSDPAPKQDAMPLGSGGDEESAQEEPQPILHVLPQYVVTRLKRGLVVVDQTQAHERVLFERFMDQLGRQQGSSQQLLFPATISLHAEQMEWWKEMQEELFTLGFRLEPFGPTTLALHGVPPMVQESEAQAVLEQVLDAYRQSRQDPRLTKNVVLARTMARNLALKPGKRLSTEEMERLLADLFQCEMPYQSPSGKPVLVTLSGADLEKLFRKTLS